MNNKIIMRYLFLILYLNISWACFSQTEKKKYYLDFADTYVLKIKIIKEIKVGKDNCSYKKGTSCNLFKIKVTEVVICPKNTFADSSSLLLMNYIVVPIKEASNIEEDSELVITARPSDSKNYLALSKILSPDTLSMIFVHQYAYLSGIVNCKKNKYNNFEKIILGL